MKKVLIAVLLLVGGMTLFTNCSKRDNSPVVNVKNIIEIGVGLN